MHKIKIGNVAERSKASDLRSDYRMIAWVRIPPLPLLKQTLKKYYYAIKNRIIN